jgi:plastocyanin
MPFEWRITIDSGKPAKFDPQNLTNVAPGDNIIWVNNDTAPHWPGLQNDKTYFMANQIAPKSTSTTFSPGSAGTINYVDSLNPDMQGSIQVIAINS